MQLKKYVVLAKRGDCAFTIKAEIAQSGGASALLVINDDEGMASYQ
jgi:signal peptide peptidase-like 2B